MTSWSLVRIMREPEEEVMLMKALARVVPSHDETFFLTSKQTSRSSSLNKALPQLANHHHRQISWKSKSTSALDPGHQSCLSTTKMGLVFSSVGPIDSHSERLDANFVVDVRAMIIGMTGLDHPLEMPLTNEPHQTTADISSPIVNPFSSSSATQNHNPTHSGLLWFMTDARNSSAVLSARTLSLLCSSFSNLPLVWL